MVKIRLMGPSEEVERIAKKLNAVLRIQEQSKPYKNRNSPLVRVYMDSGVEAKLPPNTMRYSSEKRSNGAHLPTSV